MHGDLENHKQKNIFVFFFLCLVPIGSQNFEGKKNTKTPVSTNSGALKKSKNAYKQLEQLMCTYLRNPKALNEFV